jgi:6-pyruvoyltetrahydropterin/6-carboxytetrahydropterin synthase
MRLTRTYRFSASHRLHSEQLSAEANREVYGKCNNLYGHGHDYVLRVSVSGAVDDETGRVASPGELDRYVQQRVIGVFDHKDMNTDVTGFEGVPTTENLARNIARRLENGWETAFAGLRLDRVWLRETPRNTFELRIG